MMRLGFALPLGQADGASAQALELALHVALQGGRPILLDASPVPSLDPLRQRWLAAPLTEAPDNAARIARNPGRQLPFAVLHQLGEQLSLPNSLTQTPGRPDIGLAYFRHSVIPQAHLQRAAALPLLVTGSAWHAERLREQGLHNVIHCPAGIDPALFHPAPRRGLFGERFAVFCGGAMRYHNGADLVVAAFRQFQARHPEALLVCSWSTTQAEHLAELADSAYLNGLPASANGALQWATWLARNGIEPTAVLDIGGLSASELPGVLRECDLAVFPGRATQGTPRAAMQALACGLPSVLAANTGYLELLGEHVFMLREQGDLATLRGDPGQTGWGECALEELLAMMEKAYQRRDVARGKGKAAARFMRSRSLVQQTEQLLAAIQRATTGAPLPPVTASADYAWGLCLHRGRRYAEAQAVYDRVLRHEPGHIGARMDRGHVRRELGDNAGAEADFRSVLAERPEHPQALQCLGNLLQRRGHIDDAVECLRRALTAADTPSLHWDLAWALLLLGRYREAWPHFEQRHAALGLRSPGPHKPRWDGQPVPNGSTLLVLDEQGLGDTLQFLRFLTQIPQAPGARVIFAGKPATLAVVRRLLPEADVCDWDQPLPSFQIWVPLMSLPQHLGVMAPEDVCPPGPHKLCEAERVTRWRARVRGDDARPVVGLCWRGNPDFSADAVRSPGLAALQPLLAVAGLRFVALQVGAGRREIAELSLNAQLDDLGAAIEADGSQLLDTLAVLESCDLVISSCTSLAHMAGIAGRPTWVLLSTRPDWRWMTQRSDSPWYPSLRLIRQQRPGDWAAVAQEVAQALTDWRGTRQPGH